MRQLCADLTETRSPFALVGGPAVSARTEPRSPGTQTSPSRLRATPRRRLSFGAFSIGYQIDAVVEQEAVGRLATARLRRSPEPTSPVIDLLFVSSGIETSGISRLGLASLTGSCRLARCKRAACLRTVSGQQRPSAAKELASPTTCVSWLRQIKALREAA